APLQSAAVTARAQGISARMTRTQSQYGERPNFETDSSTAVSQCDAHLATGDHRGRPFTHVPGQYQSNQEAQQMLSPGHTLEGVCVCWARSGSRAGSV
ncbi:hypothetical protein BaRGS_00004595, partial [Batillaria attramentaria]